MLGFFVEERKYASYMIIFKRFPRQNPLPEATFFAPKYAKITYNKVAFQKIFFRGVPPEPPSRV